MTNIQNCECANVLLTDESFDKLFTDTDNPLSGPDRPL